MKAEYTDLGFAVGQRARVYRNLDYKPDRVYSVLIYLRGIGWRLAGHTDNILLRDVVFIVSEQARKRVIAKSKRTVHAYASGVIVPCLFADRVLRPKAVSYNPYRFPNFYIVGNEQPVHKASYCRLSSLGLTIYG